MESSAATLENLGSVVIEEQEYPEVVNVHQSQHHDRRGDTGVALQPPIAFDTFLSPPHNVSRTNFSFPTTPRNKASTTLLPLPRRRNGDCTDTRLLMPVDSSFPDTTMVTPPRRPPLLQMRSSDPPFFPVHFAKQPGACILL